MGSKFSAVRFEEFVRDAHKHRPNATVGEIMFEWDNRPPVRMQDDPIAWALQNDEIREHLETGKTIRAIQILRAEGFGGLLECKELIDKAAKMV